MARVIDTSFFILTNENKNAYTFGRLTGGSRAVRRNSDAKGIGIFLSGENMKNERELLQATVVCFKAFGLTLFWIVLFLLLTTASKAEQISETQAVKAIMGEASNQGYDGMLAVACAIRNRGTLQGVYGVKAKHIYKEPKWVWEQARKAWRRSATYDCTNGADHWENTKAFGKPRWAKSMQLVYVCKDHNFYRSRGSK